MSAVSAGDGGGGCALVTFGQVRRWRAAPIDDAGDGMRAAVNHLVRHGEAFTAATDPRSWLGDTMTSATGNAERLTTRLENHIATATTVYKGLYAAADRLTDLEHAVRDIDGIAASRHLAVDDDGTVRDTQVPPVLTDDTAAHAYTQERNAAVQDLAARVRAVLTTATDIDQHLRTVLTRAATVTIDASAATTLAQARDIGAHAGPSPALLDALAASGWTDVPTRPESVHDFWGAISPAQRTALLTEDPTRWGNLDGIPTTDRDHANRASLARDIADGNALFAERGVMPPRTLDELNNLDDDARDRLGLLPPPVQDRAVAPIDAARLQRFRNALAIQRELEGASPNRPRFLHTYDAGAYRGDGRGAIAHGNPDTATNLAVAVPGFTSRVQGIRAVSGDASRLYDSAKKIDPDHATATIGWIGYDAPDTGSGRQLVGVAAQGKAAAGGAALVSAVRGLRANVTGTGKLTVIGHSYGSTTTGRALQDHHLADYVDQVVLIGSPGVGGHAHTATDLGLTRHTLFVGSASRDPVTNEFAGLGANPATDTFGATRFQAENIHRDEPRFQFTLGNHTSYYDANTGSESLAALSRIATGHSDLLTPDHLIAPPRTFSTATGPTGAVPGWIDPEQDRAPTGGHHP